MVPVCSLQFLFNWNPLETNLCGEKCLGLLVTGDGASSVIGENNGAAAELKKTGNVHITWNWGGQVVISAARLWSDFFYLLNEITLSVEMKDRNTD